MKRIVLCVGVVIIVASCNNKGSNIFYNLTYNEIVDISRIERKPFCIVLTDSTRELSKEYYSYLSNTYGYLASKAIYNIADIGIPENEWYIKWLCPVTVPLTCVFSMDGTLIDLIPGAAKETFLYTEEALKNLSATGFHWPNKFGLSKKNAVLYLDHVLKHKRHLDQGVYAPYTQSDGLADSLNYPYAKYLELAGALTGHDTIASQQIARQMLTLETPYSLDLYKAEFITAKKVLNPEFDMNNEPNIRVNHDKILLSGCEVNQTALVEIIVYNDGEQPLKISKIHTSCSCVKQMNGNDEKVTVQAKESVVLKFGFTPDVKGEISRDIFIASNAINMPILHINILANI